MAEHDDAAAGELTEGGSPSSTPILAMSMRWVRPPPPPTPTARMRLSTSPRHRSRSAGWRGDRADPGDRTERPRRVVGSAHAPRNPGRRAAEPDRSGRPAGRAEPDDHRLAARRCRRPAHSRQRHGEFYDDFAKRSAPFIKVVKEAKSTSTGSITEAGLESESGDSAQVLVAVAVKTSNVGAPAQEPREWRMRIAVQKVGDVMKVSNVEFVP